MNLYLSLILIDYICPWTTMHRVSSSTSIWSVLSESNSLTEVLVRVGVHTFLSHCTPTTFLLPAPCDLRPGHMDLFHDLVLGRVAQCCSGGNKYA